MLRLNLQLICIMKGLSQARFDMRFQERRDMGDLFARLILGHCMGDYLFQNNKMALSKSKKGGQGHFWCTIHALIYSVCVCLFLWEANILVFGIVFLSHWPIDRYSLGLKWSEFYGSISWRKVYTEKGKDWHVRLAFAAPVYIAVDNSMHIILMWSVLSELLGK